MKLGELQKEKCEECENCKRTVANMKHAFCIKCYKERNNRKEQRESRENITNFFIPTNNNMTKNLGHVDPIKHDRNIRLLSLNPRGFGPDSIEKIAMLQMSKERLQFDGVFFSSPDRKWDSRRKEIMRKKMFKIGRNIKINTSDTQINVNSRNGYLPGGTMSIVWDNIADLVLQSRNKDELGRWSSIAIGRGGRLIEIITFYRLVESSDEGIVTTHVQCDQVLGKHHAANRCRQIFLQDLGLHARKSLETLNVTDVLLIGDLNQHVEDQQIVQFMNANGLIDVHKHVNDLESNKLDNTFKNGTKCIDVVLSTQGLLEHVAGCQMVECDEVIMNDHRGHMVDLEIERYCEMKLSKCDKPCRSLLNNNKKSHAETFNEKANEIMKQLNVKQRVIELQNVRSREAFNAVDDLFATVFNKARSAVEGPTRSIPFSQRKLEMSNKQLYWALRVKQLQGKTINVERMQRRKDLGKIEVSCQTLAQAKEQHKQEKEKWDVFKNNQLLH